MTINKQKDDPEQRRLFKHYAQLLRPRTVLEIGSGYGRLAKLFESTEYVGVDRSRGHLRKHKYQNRILMRAPFLAFKIKFDLVYSCTALMLNKQADDIIREMARLSKRHVIFLETRKNLHWAYKYPYEEILFEEGYSLEEKINLRSNQSPLTLWRFKKVRKHEQEEY